MRKCGAQDGLLPAALPTAWAATVRPRNHSSHWKAMSCGPLQPECELEKYSIQVFPDPTQPRYDSD